MRKHNLRKKAGSIKRPKAPEKQPSAAPLAIDPQRLLHDLQVHQVGLETQNRELLATHRLLELSRDRYADLYDFAPVGYVTLDHRGLIQEINLTAAGMLGVERSRLIGLPFSLHVVKDDLPALREHLRNLARPDERTVTELGLTLKGGGQIQVEMQSMPVRVAGRKTRLCRSTLTDITRRKAAENALSNNEARLRAILDTAVEGVITIDERDLIESFNLAAARMFGYAAGEVIGRDVSLLLPAPYREEHDGYLANYLRTGQKKIIGIGREVVGQRKDGSTFPLDLSVSEVQLANRRIFTGILRDISERKRAEEALRRNEIFMAKAQEIAHVGSYQLDVPPTSTNHWSAEMFRILGLDPAGKGLTTEEYIRCLVHPDDRERVREAVDKASREGIRYDAEYRIRRPDGSIRYVHSIAEPVIGPNGTLSKLVGTLQDITERKELEKEILEISEREQRRIGQDLHDGLCQHLAGIEFRLHSLQERLAAKSKAEAAEAAGLANLVRVGIEQTRTLAHGLSPVMLPGDSLMSALKELAENTEKAFGISCSFNCPAPVLIHDNAVATHLYRIAQEAVHNAVRHGRPKFLVINLVMANGRLLVGVKDDGVGLPKRPRKHKGIGLRVMQYRAAMIGGSLVVQRVPEGGTSVVCSLRMKSGEETTP